MHSNIGVVLCSCDEGINNFIDTETLQANPAKIIKINYPCFGTGLENVKKFVSENKIKKIIIAGCNPKTHIFIFKKSLGLSPNCIEMLNLKDIEKKYSNKIIELINFSINNLLHTESKEVLNIKPIKTVMVIGNDTAALITAKNLTARAIKVILITNDKNLFNEVKNNPDIEILYSYHISQVKGNIGNYEVTLTNSEGDKTFKTGAFIVTVNDKQTGEKLKLKQDENGYFIEIKHRLKPLRYLPCGVFVAGGGYKTESFEEYIEHAYSTAAAAFNLVNSSNLLLEPVWVNINPDICRGCSTCSQICEFSAIDMINLNNGIKQAVVNQTRCTGCGVCTTVCPSGAASFKVILCTVKPRHLWRR